MQIRNLFFTKKMYLCLEKVKNNIKKKDKYENHKNYPEFKYFFNY